MAKFLVLAVPVSDEDYGKKQALISIRSVLERFESGEDWEWALKETPYDNVKVELVNSNG